MKSALINRYLELREIQQWVILNKGHMKNLPLWFLEMNRIDWILFNRYGFDISITRKN